MPPDLSLVRDWLEKAEHDLLNITNNLQADQARCPYDTVCYHAQQAAEKFLKALLTYLGIPFPKVHDLAALLTLLPTELDLLAQAGDVSELSYYANATRYPGVLDEFSREDAIRAEKQALHIRTLVLAALSTRGY